MTDSALSERQAKYFERLREAKAQGISLAEYCRRQGLDVKPYYQIARDLAAKERSKPPVVKGKKLAPSAGFAPVRIEATGVAATMCRIRHPSGWVVECASLPPPSWLLALMETQHP